MEIIASGRRGTIEKKGSIATKKANDPSKKGALIKEVQILQKLNHAGIDRVPQLIDELEDGFSYTWIKGEHFEKIYSNSNIGQKKKLATRLLDYARTLDQLGVYHGELHRPTKNVLVNKQGEVYIIDFERGSVMNTSHKNLKAVAQRLTREGFLTVDELKQRGEKDYKNLYETLGNRIRSIRAPGGISSKNQSMGSLGVTVTALGGIDLISKYLFYNLEVLSDTQLIEPILNLGSARSIPVPHRITWLGAVVVGIWIIGLYIKKEINLRPAALIVAGALGNSLDRILYGGVRDFIDIRRLFEYPIFNLADCFLVIGIGLLIIYLSKNN